MACVVLERLKNKKNLLIPDAGLNYWRLLEFAEKRTYRNLKRARIRFRIAHREGNHEKNELLCRRYTEV